MGKNRGKLQAKNKYMSVHCWIRYHYGGADHCETSGCGGKTKKKGANPWFEWCLKKGKDYEYNRDSFIQLCRSCHNKYDNKYIPPIMIGENHARSILTDDQAMEIIKRIESGEADRDIEKDFPVKRDTISKIRRNRQWKHLPRAPVDEENL